jgi:hypothetical protein
MSITDAGRASASVKCGEPDRPTVVSPERADLFVHRREDGQTFEGIAFVDHLHEKAGVDEPPASDEPIEGCRVPGDQNGRDLLAAAAIGGDAVTGHDRDDTTSRIDHLGDPYGKSDAHGTSLQVKDPAK